MQVPNLGTCFFCLSDTLLAPYVYFRSLTMLGLFYSQLSVSFITIWGLVVTDPVGLCHGWTLRILKIVPETSPNFAPQLSRAMSESPIIAWFSSLQNRGRVKFGVKHVLYYTELFYFSVDERAKVFYIFLCSVQKVRRTSPNPISYINILYNHGKGNNKSQR